MVQSLISLLVLLPVQEKPTELQKAAKVAQELKSYSFQITLRRREETTRYSGVYVNEGDRLYLASDKARLARKNGDWWIAEGKDEWKSVASGRDDSGDRRGGARARAPNDPHDLALKLADLVTHLKKERSDKIGSATVDVYGNNLPEEQAKKAMEANGRGIASMWADFAPRETGLLFHIGRADGLLYRIEQVFVAGATRSEKDDVKIVLDFGDFNRARLPKDVEELTR